MFPKTGFTFNGFNKIIWIGFSLKDFRKLSFFSAWCKQIWLTFPRLICICFKKYFEKYVEWECYRFLKCLPWAEYFWLISSGPPSTCIGKAQLIIFVNPKLILDSGERLPLVLSIAFKDVEVKILSENNLFDNSKKDFLLKLDREFWLLFSKLNFRRAEKIVVRMSLANLRIIQDIERKVLQWCRQNCFHRRSN